MSRRRRILLVSHEASRTGAPRVAAEIARALEDGGFDVTLLLRWGGALEGELRAVATRSRLEWLRQLRVLARKFWGQATPVDRFDEIVAALNLRLLRRPDVVYLNSAKSAAYARAAVKRGIPTILHIHESGRLLTETLARYRFDTRSRFLRIAACSDTVADELASALGVSRRSITVVESHTDSEKVLAAAGHAEREPKSSPVVGACALANEGKGVDLWLDVVDRIRQSDVSARFLWVGKTTKFALDEADRRGLRGIVEFAGDLEDPFSAMATMDVFCLPSRADSFPLVVLEAMALQKPVVAFDVGGVARQIGETGVLVRPGDVEAFADAVIALLADYEVRRRLGLAASERVRRLFDRAGFESDVLSLLHQVADEATSPDESFVFTRATIGVPNRAPIANPTVVDVLHAFDPSALKDVRSGSVSVLPYRVEMLAEFGCDVLLTDSMYRGFWQRPVVKDLVARSERVTAPFLQTLLAWRDISRADAVVTLFESQANSLAALRSLRVPGLRRPRLVVVACWLGRDLERFGRVRKAAYRFSYRSVDRLVFFSTNQADVFRRELGMHDSRLSSVAFGVDHEYFRPRPGSEGEAVVAVGRDLGRDWPTFLDAVRGASFAVEIACRPETLDGLSIPENVTMLGAIRRAAYRELLAEAQVVVIATKDVQYPSGQSVMLEAMAMAKCCIVTSTPALSEYVTDGETALVVPPNDPDALRAAIDRARREPGLRARLGASARQAIEESFNARAMWGRIGEIVRDPAL